MKIELVSQLQKISQMAKKAVRAEGLRPLIQEAQKLAEAAKVKVDGGSEILLGQLDTELLTWLSKLDIILKEPAGRNGMAKHANFWAERIDQCHMN